MGGYVGGDVGCYVGCYVGGGVGGDVGGYVGRVSRRRNPPCAGTPIHRHRRSAHERRVTPAANPPYLPYASSTLQPVVLRASRSRCACAACASG